MEPTYKIIGGDGRQYGPVSLNQLKDWIAEGRVDAESQVMRSDQSVWGPAAVLAELGLEAPPTPNAPAAPAGPAPTSPAPAGPATAGPAAAGPAASPSPPAAAAPEPALDLLKLANTAKSGAGWFYWIAGLSLVNSVLNLAGQEGGFVIGLGVTQLFDAIASGLDGSGKLVALVLDLLAAGVFIFFGVFASRRQTWAFIVGMLLYALDGLIFVLAEQWFSFSVGFHVFVLFCLFAGLNANQKLKAIATA